MSARGAGARGGLVGLFLLALAASQAAVVGAQAPPCAPVLHVLANGDPAAADGAVRVPVDGLGAFGGDTASGGNAVFNPPGPTPPAGSTRTSHVYLSAAQRFLVDDCGDTEMVVVSQSPTTFVTETESPIGGLTIRVTQTLGPISSGTSTLSQSYELQNDGVAPVPVTLVRHLDGDLLYDGSFGDRAGADGAAGATLFHLDAGERTTSPGTLLGISGALDGDTSPGRWTVQPYDYKPAIAGNGGIPPTDHGTVAGDGDGDRLSDGPFDATLSQQWDGVVPAGGSLTYTTATRFGANAPPTAAADALTTAAGAAASVDVLANDADPDGDTLSVATAAPAAAHGSVACAAGGSCTYTPAAGYSGPDSFAYTASDGRGGSASADVAVTVSAPVERGPAGPTPGVDVTAQPVSGTILVRLPGTDRFVPLTEAADLPVGTQVDATVGTVRLTAASAAAVRDTADFFEGLFTIQQARTGGVTQLRLDGGNFEDCPALASAEQQRKPRRRLWGSGKGRFRTKGRFSSATVRGTKWLTEDRCEGTLTVVTEGSVLVRDALRHANVVVGAGQSYLAAPVPSTRSLQGVTCTLRGTPRRDVLVGTRGRDVVCGLGGNDVIRGLGGADILLGGAGNDTIYGGDGKDRILGGAGGDVLYGGADGDGLFGEAGSDRLRGGGGADLLVGGLDRDVLLGGPGPDLLVGGRGADFLHARDGKRGNDVLVGGGGRDRCVTDFLTVCP